ncbi:MFS-type transporter penM [Exophiala dermatitidis]
MGTEEKEQSVTVGVVKNETKTESRRRSTSSSVETIDDTDTRDHGGGQPADLEKAFSKNEDNDVGVTVTVTADPNVVDWDGPDDPENPLNWTPRRKWFNILLLAVMTTLTPLASSMFAPGVPQVMKEFHSTNNDLGSFVVSVFVLGYAFGPLLIAPLSEVYGRLPIYHTNTFLFLVFSIACARSTSLGMLIGFRFLAGVAGSCPLTVGSGSIADTFRQEERGKAMSVWTFPILFGPTLGPVIGSYLSAASGWRWDFYLVAICAGVLFVAALIFQRETYPLVVLERKARRLRKQTGNEKLRSALGSTRSPGQLLMLSIVRPLKMLFLSPIVFGLSLYHSVTYGYLYILFTTLTTVFEGQYGISASNVGLTYLGMGVGQFAGLVLFGIFSDKLIQRKGKAKGGELKPEYRLPLLWPGAVALPVGLILYGWTAQYKVHWIVPIIATTLLGGATTFCFMPIGVYLVDAYTSYAASAMAANTVLRSIGGAFLPLAGPRMYAALKLGWGNTLLAFMAIALTPMIWLFTRYGERLRTHPKLRLNL